MPLIEAAAMLAGRILRGLTFELRRGRRQAARPRPQRMYTVPVAGALWLAVGPRLERRVRPRSRRARHCIFFGAPPRLPNPAYGAAGATLERKFIFYFPG